jgi:hypothetical protein
VFRDLVDAAISRVSERDAWTAAEVSARGVFPRGADSIPTAPIVELARALGALVERALPAAPEGASWFYGLPTGRTTLAMRSA